MSGPVGKFAIVRLPGKLPALDTFGSCLDWKRGLIPVELWFSMCAGIGGAHATRKSIPTTCANVFSTIAMFISESQLKEIIKSPQAVAIVGAGPAGITIAMELEALGIESLLLEAGGFDFPDEEANDPYRGEVTGRPYSLDASRLRYFGGTSNHWGGGVVPASGP